MTHKTTLDVGAIAARREASTPTARQKPQADFGQAFQRAEHHHEARPDAKIGAKPHDHHADRAEKPSAPKDDDAPKADDAQQAAAPAEAQQAATQQAATQQADAQQAQQGQDAKQDQGQAQADAQQAQQAQQALDPQDQLQLMLATGAQLAVTRQADATNAAAQATTTLTAVDGQAQAQAQAMTQAQAQVDAQVQAQAQAADQATAQQAAQPQAQAQATEAKPQQPAQAQAEAQPQVPDLLAQAAGSLGPIKVTVGKAEQPANLTVALLDDQADVASTEGPIAQVTKLDGAPGIETASQPVDLLPTDDDKQPEAKLETDLQPAAPQINAEPKAEQAKAAEKGDAPAAPHEVIKQILDRAEQIKGAQQNSIKLQLYPEHLGKMEIRVMSHQGLISAQLTADTPQAKSLLDGQLAQLQRSFAEMGLKVDKVEVTLSSANLGQDASNPGFTGFDQQPQQQHQREPQHQAMRQGAGLGYEQWLPETQDDGSYVVTGPEAGINYVA